MRARPLSLLLPLLLGATARAGDPTTAPADPSPDPPVRLAVLDFRVGGGLTPHEGTALADIVRAESHRADRYELIDRNLMKERMDEKDWTATTECDQVRCLVKFGKSLDAQKIAGGFVTSFGKAWTLTIRLVDVNTGREEQTFTTAHRGEMEDLLGIARQGAAVVFGLAPAPGNPPLSPTTQPRGTRSADLPKTLTLDLGAGVKMEMVIIPAGEFVMGSPNNERGRLEVEGPQHRVRITESFYLGMYEVTQAQWQAVMGSNPSQFKSGGDFPVEMVSWNDCQAFCRKLSLRAEHKVRLPTEAEWEYACRAGTTTVYSFGVDDGALADYAWFAHNSGKQTHAVGQKRPNAWGLYDMHGNMWEWCNDWYSADYYSRSPVANPRGPTSGNARVQRGGSWTDVAHYVRSAIRIYGPPDVLRAHNGFRLALDSD